MLGYEDRKRYTLQHNDFTPLVVTDPIGYDESSRQYSRNKKQFGLIVKDSNSLVFVNDASSFILNIENIYGINSQLRLLIDVRHPQTNLWVRDDTGHLDFKTIKKTEQGVSIKFNSSKLTKTIKSRESQKVELERLDTIDGSTIPSLRTELAVLKGRKIFLQSLLEVKETDALNEAFRMNFHNETRSGVLSIPTTVSYKSDVKVHDVAKGEFRDWGPGGSENGNTLEMFYADNDTTKTLSIDISVYCKIKEKKVDDMSNAFLKVDLVRYNNGITYDLIERINLYTVPNPYSINGHIIDFTYSGDIELLEGESLALQWYGGGYFGGALNDGDFDVDFEDTAATINISEDSYREPSQTKCILPFELLDRLLYIITGEEDLLYSEILGRTDLGYDVDGELGLMAVTHGHWIRSFDKFPESEDNKYKPFTTSYKDAFNSFMNIWNLGMGIEFIGGRERVVIEKRSYFFNRNTTVKLGKEIDGVFKYVQVSKVERTIAADYYYSEVELGGEKGGEYEEIQGLDESNAKSTYTTSIYALENSLKILSKYRLDAIGQEIERRKPKIDFPTTDSKGDKHIWFLDLKRSSTSIFEEKVWSDDFDQAPTGIFDPGSATKLRLSPFNILLRWGWWIGAGLTKYSNGFVKFGSSEGNANLSTKLIGGVEYKENGEVQNSELERAIFVPEWVTFEFPVDFDLMAQIEGKTLINGREVPNIYGVFEFENEDGKIEKAHLWDLSPKGAGKFKLLKFNQNAK